MDNSNINFNLDGFLKTIRKERKKQDISQSEIANMLNISQNAYSLIETGKQKMLAIEYFKIKEILHITDDFLNKNIEKADTKKIENININKLIDSTYLLAESNKSFAESNKSFATSIDRLVTINEKNSDLIVKLCNK